MTTTRLAISTAALLTLLPCRDPREARREADRRQAQATAAAWQAADRAYYRALPPCSLPPAGDTRGWRAVPWSPVPLPPGFRPDPAPPGYMHGGRGWVDGRRLFEIVGQTGTSPGIALLHGLARDTAGVTRRCRLRVDGGPAVYTVREAGGRYTASVRHTLAGQWRNVSYELSGPRGDGDLLLRLLRPLAAPAA